MTRVGRLSAGVWPTAAALAASCLIGFWAGGAGFGYTLLVVTWLPIGAVVSIPGRQTRQTSITLLTAIVVASLPWWWGEPPAAALRLILLTAGLIATLTGVSAVLSQLVRSSSAAAAVSACVWLAWVAGPLLRADGVYLIIGGTWADRWLAVNPLLYANAVSPTAADWTHQAVAYRWLTALGQDVAFEWAGNGFGVIMSYAASGLLMHVMAGLIQASVSLRRGH